MDTYLVAYDISNPKRLRKVARTCEDFGLRKQFSVFFCQLTAQDLIRLKSRLYDVINLDQDQACLFQSARDAPRRSRRWVGRSSRTMHATW